MPINLFNYTILTVSSLRDLRVSRNKKHYNLKMFISRVFKENGNGVDIFISYRKRETIFLIRDENYAF